MPPFASLPSFATANGRTASPNSQSIVSLIDGIGVRVMLTGGEISAKRQKELVDSLIDNLPHSTKTK
jgi:hypothetical protein